MSIDNNLKIKIMVRAFQIRIANGESFDDVKKSYPVLTEKDLNTIKEALK